MVDLHGKIQRTCLNSLIFFSFLSIVMGSFYSVLLSPEKRAETLINQAHDLYTKASYSDDILEVRLLLQNAEEFTNMAQQYTPNNNVLGQEKIFFQQAQHEIDNDEFYFSNATSNFKIK